ncbi:VWA domain-containing protein, partial [Crocinitomix sp.]|nr:VWA domain-containing protein [Crocinitomix sp.]
DTTALADLPDSVFDIGHFKLNNITFILDVSSSMNSVGKLELLKLSMTELVKVLRDDDLITILKYSSTVDVVVEGMHGKDKEEITERVAELRTSSSTAGGDAIEEAYRMNRQVYSGDRNNIVIMITDGAFNSGSKEYLQTIASNYEKRGVIFSVVGIKTSTYITDHMRGIVEQGGGDFIEIRTVEDAQTKIINEIKRTSFRGR